jgi:hypothetical protein
LLTFGRNAARMVSMSRVSAKVPDEVALLSRQFVAMAIEAVAFGLFGAALLAWTAISP